MEGWLVIIVTQSLFSNRISCVSTCDVAHFTVYASIFFFCLSVNVALDEKTLSCAVKQHYQQKMRKESDIEAPQELVVKTMKSVTIRIEQ